MPKKKLLKKKPYKRVFPEKMTEETAHYSAILIENLEDKFKFVTEAVAGFQESFPRQMTEMETRLQQGINDTQKALKVTRKALEERIDKVETTLDAKIDKVDASLNAKIDKVDASLDAKIDKVDASLNAKIDKVDASLNAKIDKVEINLAAKIDRINEVVIRHDGEIASLRKTA